MKSTNLNPASFPLKIHLLGPCQVQVEGQPLARRHSRKELWLLALLVLRNGREVERDWLAGTLWPESLNSRALLRDTLSDLRRTLGVQAGRLLAPTAHTLMLNLEGAEVDVVDFDAAISRGDPLSLAAAAALYQGPLLEGCLEEWVWLERQSREQAYLSTLEVLAQQAMHAGEAAKAAEYLRLVIATDPLRESAQRGLLQALAARGDYPAAVLVYRELRLLLHRELNAEPAVETKALFEQLRQQARNPAQNHCKAVPQQAVVNSSTVRTSVLQSEPLPASDLVSASTPLFHNLPVPLTSFIGRELEIDTVSQLLSSKRLLTLTGAGGCGKTRLALQVAEMVASDYPDGVWWVELASLSDTALVVQGMARSLGLREEPGCSLQQTLVEHLKTRQALLVLDNCEHLLEACAQLVETLLQTCPTLKILVTSREALHVEGEQPWRVPPMVHPPAEPYPLTDKEKADNLLKYDACRLFVERARVQQPEFTLTPHNASALVQLCERLDGMPLALELAASRLRVLSLVQLCERLQDRFRLLQGGARNAPTRHQTLRALIDWSYERLDPEEQKLLQRLSVFTGGWTLEAAERVCVGERIQEWEVLDLLTSLVDKSLVAFEAEVNESGRYHLLETIRQYAQERLAESKEEEVLRGRHRDYFLWLAENAEPQLTGPEQRVWYERLDAEHANLRTALEWGLEEGKREEGRGKRGEKTEQGEEREGKRDMDPSLPSSLPSLPCIEMGLRLVGALWRFWEVRGYLGEGRGYLAEALGNQGAGTRTKERAKALHGAGILAWKQGEFTAARLLHEESLSIRLTLGDKQGIAASLNNLGNVAHDQGDYGAARALYEQSLAIQRELRNMESITALLNNLGEVASDQRDYTAARVLYGQSLALWRELGNKGGIAHSLNNLGNVAYDQGDYGAARALNVQSLELWRELGNRRGIAESLEAFAQLAVAKHQPERAVRLWGAAQAVRVSIGSPLTPKEQKEYDQQVAAAQEALGAEMFAQEWSQGSDMVLEQAIEYALETQSTKG